MEMESRWSLAVTSGTSVMESRLRRSGTVMWRAVCLWMLLVGVLHAEVTNKGKKGFRLIYLPVAYRRPQRHYAGEQTTNPET